MSRKTERSLFKKVVEEPNEEPEVPEVNWRRLFMYLDHRLTHGESCDTTLRLTEEYCKRHRIDFEYVEEVLSEYGGFCDCEVLFNSSDRLDEEPPFKFLENLVKKLREKKK